VFWGAVMSVPLFTYQFLNITHKTMPKVISKRTFLLKSENGKDIIAKKGEAITVTPEEFKKFKSDFIELKK
jgi:hypothetical protein